MPVWPDSNRALGIRGLGASLEAPPLSDLLKQAAELAMACLER